METAIKNKAEPEYGETAEVLQKFLTLKKSNYPGFSMRTLARQMGLSASYMSRVISGKKPLPITHLDQLCRVLEIDDTGQSKLHRALLKEKVGHIPIGTRSIVEPAQKSDDFETQFVELNKHSYFLLEEWYYVPILDLICCDDFSSDPRWIAKKLGLKTEEVKIAWTKLIDKGFIKPEGSGWKKVPGKCRLPSLKSHRSIRKFHRMSLRNADRVLSKTPTEQEVVERFIKTGVFASTKEDFLEAKKILDQAMMDVAKLLLEKKEAEDVYQLSIQYFSLSSSE